MICVNSRHEFEQIAETGQPLGLFYSSNPCGYECLDNRTGQPVRSEWFGEKDEAISWLAARVEADRERSAT